MLGFCSETCTNFRTVFDGVFGGGLRVIGILVFLRGDRRRAPDCLCEGYNPSSGYLIMIQREWCIGHYPEHYDPAGDKASSGRVCLVPNGTVFCPVHKIQVLLPHDRCIFFFSCLPLFQQLPKCRRVNFFLSTLCSDSHS